MTKRKKSLVIASASLLILIISAFLLAHWLHGSSVGIVHVGTPTKSIAPTSQPLTLTNAYFSTELPAGFALRRQQASPTSPDSLITLVAITPSTQDEQFAVTVGTLSVSGISGLSDYNLRATLTTLYTPYVPANLPTGATAFRTVSGPSAFTVFWPHGTKYAEIALSTDRTATLDQLNTVFQHALSTWKWL